MEGTMSKKETGLNTKSDILTAERRKISPTQSCAVFIENLE
jgi:hypothetical protein